MTGSTGSARLKERLSVDEDKTEDYNKRKHTEGSI